MLKVRFIKVIIITCFILYNQEHDIFCKATDIFKNKTISYYMIYFVHVNKWNVL